MVDLSNLTPSPKSHLRFVPACWENRRPRGGVSLKGSQTDWQLQTEALKALQSLS